MDEMIGYIFGNLKISESAIRKITQTLKYQSRINRNVACFTVMTAIGFAVVNKTIKEQHEQIKKLSKEIERMKEPTEGRSDTCQAE